MSADSNARPWLRHYPEEVAPSFDYPKHNVAVLLEKAAADFPDQHVVEFMGKAMTYRELLASAYRFAGGLRSLGVKVGERVAIMLPNCPQMVIAYYGTLIMGGIVVMTNPLYMEGELAYQLEDSGATVIVTLDVLFTRVLGAKQNSKLNHYIITSIYDYLPFPKNWLYPLKMKLKRQSLTIPKAPGVVRFKRWLALSMPLTSPHLVDAEQDVAVIQYTGGTTGKAKGVMLTHYNLISNTLQTSNWFYSAERGKETFLSALPCFHVFGLTVLLHLGIHLAGKLILLPRFDALQVLKYIEKEKVTIFPGAPTMYIAINHHKKVVNYDLSSVQACVSGSAPLPLEVQERFEAITGGRLIEGYGLTEASPITHANPLRGCRKMGTIGVPFPDTEAKIIHPETGEDLPVGAVGELAVRGPQIMKGYWNRPEETREVLQDGWLITGDMAKMDEDGYFSIVDRKKEMINASGFKVFPRDVEEVLFEHPQVKEATVIGVPDPYRGETVKAFIVRVHGSTITEEELVSWCRAKLAAFKIPRQIEFRSELPKTMVGKVLRRKLAEEEAQRRLQHGERDGGIADEME